MKRERSKGEPHLAWADTEFLPRAPKPPPKLHVEATVMHAAHKRFGRDWKGSRKGTSDPTDVEAIADTGCQTCTAGTNVVEKLGCPKTYLVPTKHRIMGITETSLAIQGVVFLRIKVGNRETRQMVYVSDNVNGLYLSEAALKELHVIDEDFPSVAKDPSMASQVASQANEQCECKKRTVTPDRPAEIPYPATKENVPRLKEWLIGAFAASAFNTCTHQKLHSMTGEPVNVRFKKGCSPHAVHTPIPIPHHWKRQVKADIDRDVRLGIIEPVPQGTPTTWCSRMVVAAKKDGSPRRTVDLQQLNKATSRETHHTPTPFNLASTVPANTRKTVVDAWNGYHSLLLSPSAREATTFITEWGRYRYCRAPMGFHASGDAYTRRFDDITVGEPRTVRCIDDSLLWDDAERIDDSFWHTFDYIKLCADNGIIFNREKFQFAQEEVEFAGFSITKEGMKPPKRIIAAIREFPTPRNITDVRAWFGLVNQVAYAFSQAETMAPFRELLASKKRAFFWDSTMDELFQASKEEVIRLVHEGVRTFEMSRPTCLCTDWSKKGVGFSLLQKHCGCDAQNDPNCGDGHWKLVFAGSRFTKEAESRYAPVEGEALAVVYGLQSCRMFVMGCSNLTVVVDHKPLTKILNDRQLESIDNPRLLRLKEKTLMYSFEIVHVPGSTHKTADATSRNPCPLQDEEETSEDEEACAISYAARIAEDAASVTWERVKVAAVADEECAALVDRIQEGFPAVRDDLPAKLRPYWTMRDDLYVVEGVPFKGHKMLIPPKLRSRVLEGLHAAHQGVTGMRANARERFFWPGLDAAICQIRAQCRQCNEKAPSQPADTMIITPPPELPFQQTVTDFCQIEGHDFLVYADRYSGWLEVAKLGNKTWKSVHNAFLHWFTEFGVPEEMSCDGGPPFNSATFNQFLDRWGIQKRLSSAYYPQSNGRAESAVKSADRILHGNVNPVTGELDTEAAARAIMSHRNTPVQDTGISPALTLYGRPLRDHLPSRKPLRKEWNEISEAREAALARRHLRKPAELTREMEPLLVGDVVQLQNQCGNKPIRWYKTGTIVAVLPHRQYRILVDGSRRVTLRNRRFLKKIDPVCARTGRQACVEAPQAVPDTPTSAVEQRASSTAPRTPATIEVRRDATRTGRDATEIETRRIATRTGRDATGIETRSGILNEGATPSRPRGAPMIPRQLRVACPGAEPRVEMEEPDSEMTEAPLAIETTPPRRGARQRHAPKPFSPKLYGQSHV